MTRVAVMQMKTDDQNPDRNIEKITKLLEETFQNRDTERPVLVLGPEFAINGYSYNVEEAWSFAEKRGGRTEQLLCTLAKQHDIFFGTTYLEKVYIRDEGTEQVEVNFYNTFALASPNGSIEGRVQKSRPCSLEAYIFKSSPSTSSQSHIIQCSNGWKVGVLICYENILHDPLKQIQSTGCDLLLQPFSGPLTSGGDDNVKEKLRHLYSSICHTNARLLHCPALYCNKVGKWSSDSPTILAPSYIFDPEFPGESKICDANGKILCQLNDTEEGIAIADVEINNTVNQTSEKDLPSISKCFGGYTDPSLYLKSCMIFEWFGLRAYEASKLRKDKAGKILNGTGEYMLGSS